MENLIYKKALSSDIDILTETRMEVLRAVFKIDQEADMSEIRAASRKYYKESLDEDMHVAYLVFERQGEKEIFAGAGGVSFYQVMPTCDNSTGKKAYIMNMYTRPDYRRRGIAGQVLQLLIREAGMRDIHHITLDASDMGRPVYEKYGFVQMKDEMKLQADSI